MTWKEFFAFLQNQKNLQTNDSQHAIMSQMSMAVTRSGKTTQLPQPFRPSDPRQNQQTTQRRSPHTEMRQWPRSGSPLLSPHERLCKIPLQDNHNG